MNVHISIIDIECLAVYYRAVFTELFNSTRVFQIAIHFIYSLKYIHPSECVKTFVLIHFGEDKGISEKRQDLVQMGVVQFSQYRVF